MAERRREASRTEPGGTNASPGSDKFDIHFQVIASAAFRHIIYIHVQALCSAVEQEKVEKARSILEHQTHVNSTQLGPRALDSRE